jgi:predicted nucleotidyltransferase
VIVAAKFGLRFGLIRMRAGAHVNHSLVSRAIGIIFCPVSQSNTQVVSRHGGRRAGDLVLPPPLPPRRRGTRRPPTMAAIVRLLGPFCRQHGITKLEIFGSVARGEATAGSDVDLIATFDEHPGLQIVAIEEAMGELLGVRVDLLTRESVDEMTNPFRRESIERDRRTIYAA